MKRALGTWLVGLALVAAWAVPALAAPVYLSSEPPEDAELEEAPGEVRVTFSEPLDAGSSMLVRNECGGQIDDKNVEVLANEMTVGISSKPKGVYKVFYLARGLAGATGTTEGSFTFKVTSGPACAAPEKEQPHRHQGHDMGGKKQGRHGHHGGAAEHSAGSDHDPSSTSTHVTHGQASSHATDGHGGHGPSKKSGPVSSDAPNASGSAPVTNRFPALAADDATRSSGGDALLASLALALVCGALGGLLLRVIDER